MTIYIYIIIYIYIYIHILETLVANQQIKNMVNLAGKAANVRE